MGGEKIAEANLPEANMEGGNMPEANNVPGGNVAKINANVAQNQSMMNKLCFKRIILQELSQEESQVIEKYKKIKNMKKI